MSESENKELVKTALNAVFVERDISALDRYWGTPYTQHNPKVANGVDNLKKVVASLPSDFKYEMGMIMAEGKFVMVHGRYTGWRPNPMIAVDIFRIEGGKLVEHWDVLQEEVGRDQTVSGNQMFPTS